MGATWRPSDRAKQHLYQQCLIFLQVLTTTDQVFPQCAGFPNPTVLAVAAARGSHAGDRSAHATSITVQPMNTTTLQVDKTRLSHTRLHTAPATPLTSGQVRVRVESFALTANNITYAAFGDAMSYWQFWPTDDAQWGVVPVWGFGAVTESQHAGVAVGERLYGYWPMASHAVLQPDRLGPQGFADAAPHRASLHPVYNQLLRCSADPFYTPDTEAVQALLRPLYMTSWLIDDFLADNAFFGADVMLLSSASSKTAYGTAFQLAQRPGLQVVGLTSERNRAFCEGLGCYSQVLSYEQLEQLPANTACV